MSSINTRRKREIPSSNSVPTGGVTTLFGDISPDQSTRNCSCDPFNPFPQFACFVRRHLGVSFDPYFKSLTEKSQKLILCWLKTCLANEWVVHCAGNITGTLDHRCRQTVRTHACSWRDKRFRFYWDGVMCRPWDHSVCPVGARLDADACSWNCGGYSRATTVPGWCPLLLGGIYYTSRYVHVNRIILQWRDDGDGYFRCLPDTRAPFFSLFSLRCKYLTRFYITVYREMRGNKMFQTT